MRFGSGASDTSKINFKAVAKPGRLHRAAGAALTDAQRFINYRLNAMPGMSSVGPGAANPYFPGGGRRPTLLPRGKDSRRPAQHTLRAITLMIRQPELGTGQVSLTVNAPNGAVVNLPDGTATDTIKSVMVKNFGGPSKDEAPASLAVSCGLSRAVFRSSAAPEQGRCSDGRGACSGHEQSLFRESRLKGILVIGQRYQEALKTQEGEDKALSEKHPIASTAAEIGGAFQAWARRPEQASAPELSA